MSIRSHNQSRQLGYPPEHHPTRFVIDTGQEHWVIPNSSELLKTLLKEQRINVEDLQFSSTSQCNCFIKKLFLLALEDEYKTHAPSTLAEFARKLIEFTNTHSPHNYLHRT